MKISIDAPFDDWDADAFRTMASLTTTGALTSQDIVYIIAVCAGVKPGVHLTDSVFAVGDGPSADAWQRTHPLAQAFDALDIPYRFDGSAGGFHGSQFINVDAAHDAAHLDYAPPYTTSDGETTTIPDGDADALREWGRFIGVPGPDNCWWYRDEWDHPDIMYSGIGCMPAAPYLPVCDYVGRELDHIEMRAVRQVSYVPEPTTAGIDRAIELGHAFYEACDAFDRAFEACMHPTDEDTHHPGVNATAHATRHVEPGGTFVAAPDQ